MENELTAQISAIEQKCDEILSSIDALLDDPDFLIERLNRFAKNQFEREKEKDVPFRIIRSHGNR